MSNGCTLTGSAPWAEGHGIYKPWEWHSIPRAAPSPHSSCHTIVSMILYASLWSIWVLFYCFKILSFGAFWILPQLGPPASCQLCKTSHPQLPLTQLFCLHYTECISIVCNWGTLITRLSSWLLVQLSAVPRLSPFLCGLVLCPQEHLNSKPWFSPALLLWLLPNVYNLCLAVVVRFPDFRLIFSWWTKPDTPF